MNHIFGNSENFCGQEKIDSDLQFWYFSYGVCQILVGVLTSESGKPRKNGLYEGYTQVFLVYLDGKLKDLLDCIVRYQKVDSI